MKSTVEKKRLLSIGEASEYLGVSIDTLRRWEKRGRIEPLRSPGNHRYFSKESLDKLFGKKYQHDASNIKDVLETKTPKTANNTHQSLKTKEDQEKTPESPHPNPSNSPSATLIPFTNKTIDRPAREINVPLTQRVRIIKTEEVHATNYGVEINREKITSASILTPSDLGNILPQKTLESSNKFGNIPREEKRGKITKNKLITYFLIFSLLLLGIAVIFFLIGFSSQKMLSPVP